MPANAMYDPARRQRDVSVLADAMFSCIFPPIPTHRTPDRLPERIEFPKHRSIPEVKKIYFNSKHTTIEWADGTKTTVGCIEGQEFDEYGGFAAAVLKKMFGTSKAAVNYMNEHKEVQPEPSKKCKKEVIKVPVEVEVSYRVKNGESIEVVKETAVAQDA